MIRSAYDPRQAQTSVLKIAFCTHALIVCAEEVEVEEVLVIICNNWPLIIGVTFIVKIKPQLDRLFKQEWLKRMRLTP